VLILLPRAAGLAGRALKRYALKADRWRLKAINNEGGTRMKSVVGIFKTRADAEAAVERVRSFGVAEERITFLAPGTPPQQVEAAVPTTDAEQPGVGEALGGVVGGAIGAATGGALAAGATSLFVPGIGPIIAAGFIGAALLGAWGAATGTAAGAVAEAAATEGVPVDELYVYEDALRKGRSVVIVMAADEPQAEAVHAVLVQAGAESIDAAREEWWIGLRDAAREEYTAQGGDFTRDEPLYRRGFEAALHPRARGRAYDDAAEYLRECHGEACDTKAFRRGYERGSAYHQSLTQAPPEGKAQRRG
jgi:uncharacterized protein YegP (UPF0339 family)